MALTGPKLDDRGYADLLQEALDMLPRLAPQWTNHNPSDPGITVIELLAWFSDTFLYRLDRISREAKLRFLDLLLGPDADGRSQIASAPVAQIDSALRAVARALTEPQRAVSASDFELLVRRATAQAPPERRVARVYCAARRDLAAVDFAWERDRPGHVSLVLVPEQMASAQHLQTLLEQVRDYLEPRRLLGTRLHVVGPRYLRADLGVQVHRLPGADPQPLRSSLDAALQRFFSPLPGGGPRLEGWPFGRPILLSEIYAELDRLPGVDWVDAIRVLRLGLGVAPPDAQHVGIQVGTIARLGEDARLGSVQAVGAKRLLRDDSGRLVGVALRPYELASVHLRPEDLNIVN